MTEGMAVTVTTLWSNDPALEELTDAVSLAAEDTCSVAEAAFVWVVCVPVLLVLAELSFTPPPCRRRRTADSIVAMFDGG